MSLRRAGAGLIALLMLAALAAGIDGFAIEPASIRVSPYALALRQAPAPLSGLKIAVISDLHAGAPFIDEAKIARIVALSNAEQPDLVLLTGDIFVNDVIGGRPIDPGVTAAALGQLRARLGVYLVFGNHDHDTDMAELRRLLAKTAVRVMDNAVQRIDEAGAGFWLIGLADFGSDAPDVAGTLAQITDTAPVLAFTHNPDVFPLLPARVNLLVAGHTHGGQVRLPLFGRGRIPSMYGRARFAAGHVVEQTDLFVSTGIGTSHIPVRFGVPPEISLLTLTQAASP